MHNKKAAEDPPATARSQVHHPLPIGRAPPLRTIAPIYAYEVSWRIRAVRVALPAMTAS